MVRNTRRRLYFIAGSLLWAILLYSVSMIALNWGDMKNGLKGRYVTISSQCDTIIYKIGPSGIDALQSLLPDTRRIVPSFSLHILKFMP